MTRPLPFRIQTGRSRFDWRTGTTQLHFKTSGPIFMTGHFGPSSCRVPTPSEGVRYETHRNDSGGGCHPGGVEDPGLSYLKIDVGSKAGDVLLSGYVPNVEAESRLIQIARGVKGVKSVKSALKIQSK
jgi:hypothetical protein